MHRKFSRFDSVVTWMALSWETSVLSWRWKMVRTRRERLRLNTRHFMCCILKPPSTSHPTPATLIWNKQKFSKPSSFSHSKQPIWNKGVNCWNLVLSFSRRCTHRQSWLLIGRESLKQPSYWLHKVGTAATWSRLQAVFELQVLSLLGSYVWIAWPGLVIWALNFLGLQPSPWPEVESTWWSTRPR